MYCRGPNCRGGLAASQISYFTIQSYSEWLQLMKHGNT